MLMSLDKNLIEYFHAYLLTEKRVAKNTFLAYKQDVTQLEKYLKEKKILWRLCKKRDISNFLKKLKSSGLKSKTLSRKISSIKLLFEFMCERFKIPNVARSLIFPKIEKCLPSYLTEKEVQKLLAAANHDNSNKGIRNKVMIYLLYASGMRVSELVSLTSDQIQFDTGFIKLSGKGNKERIIPLPKNILELLRYYLNHIHTKLVSKKNIIQTKKQNYLFATTYNNQIKPISRQSFWIILKKILQRAAIFKNVSPHSLRHSLATHLLKKGADIRSLQLLLGHESISTVQIYTHLENSELRKIYDKKHPRA